MNYIEEVAQKIQDLYFERGATISQGSWEQTKFFLAEVDRRAREETSHTPQTTPDTEREELVEKVLKHSPLKAFFEDEPYQSVDVYADTKERIRSLLSSRDTYWKERVRVTYKDVEKFGNLFWDNDFDVSMFESQRMADCINEVLLKRLTNEDKTNGL